MCDARRTPLRSSNGLATGLSVLDSTFHRASDPDKGRTLSSSKYERWGVELCGVRADQKALKSFEPFDYIRSKSIQ